MISVIIPLYNKAPYLAKTLQSVWQQSFAAFEVIIVNDGSTDESAMVIQDNADSRLRVLTTSNRGVSSARNTGIKAATYEWIALLDADDWWEPTFLEEMVNAIVLHSDKNLFASGRTRVFTNASERYQHSLLPIEGAIDILNYYQVISKHLPPINASNGVFKRTLFDAKGYFNTSLTHYEDHDLWLRLAKAEPIVFINKPLSFYNKAIKNAQSKKGYPAEEFIIYLNTIKEVCNSLNEEDKKYVNTYLQRFGCFSYLKNYKQYTKTDRLRLKKALLPELRGSYYLAMRLTYSIPWINFYTLFKKVTF